MTFSYELLWGKLFAFSPVMIGFSKHALQNTIVYVQNGAEFSEYAQIDSLTVPVEEFHQLKFIHKPKIIIFRDKDSYYRQTTTKARFCAYPSDVIVCAPWAMQEARDGKISLEIYLRHEMSHILLYQYKDLLDKFRYPNWLLEGVAMYSAAQMGTGFYPGKDETYRIISQGNYLDPRDFHTSREEKAKIDVQNRIAFIYSEFGCIIDYLVDNFGRDKFLLYIKKLTKENNHDKVFKEVYGIEFDQFLRNFQNHVLGVSGIAVPETQGVPGHGLRPTTRRNFKVKAGRSVRS
jgi:hypothetical protein